MSIIRELFCTNLKDERLDYYGKNSFLSVELDGIEVYQTDSTWWAFVKDFIEASSITVANVKLRFRDHIIDIPDSPVYYYSKGIIAEFCASEKDINHCHVIGTINANGELECPWYKSPELIIIKTSIKKVCDCKEENLIWLKKEPKIVDTSQDTAAVL